MKKKTKSKNSKGAKTGKLSAAIEETAPTETPAEPTQTHASPPAQSSAATGGKVAKARESKTAEKPAKPTRKRAGKKITKRYSPESKAEILEFVRDHDAANRRGGKSAAVRKYGVTALTLSNWLKASKMDGKRVKAGGKAKAPVSTKRGRTAGSGTGSIEATLNRMLEIRNRVATLMTEFESLKARI
jgi:transposase-like protein